MQVSGLRSERKTLNSSRSKQDRENTIIESQRTTKSTERLIRTTADRGQVSMSHHNVVHKTVPTPTAMNMIEAKAGGVQIYQSS